MPSATSTTGQAAGVGNEGMEGYLLKKNRLLGIWSWRWAVLDRSSQPLTLSLYFKRRNSTEGRKARETLEITGTTSIKMPSHCSKSNRYFTVTSIISKESDSGGSANDGKRKEQRWHLCAGSMQSLLVWKEKVDEAISDAKEHEMLSRVEVVDESSSNDSFGLSTISCGKYQAIKQIGKGSYGSVISALDRDRQVEVAIKKVDDVFDDLVDAKRVVREIRALRSLSHDNIVRLIDLPMPPAPGNFRDLYIVTELMEQDLYSVIYHHQKLSTDHIQFICYQMLCALQYIHSAGVIHRDLKPQNVLISSDCKVKLCGKSRLIASVVVVCHHFFNIHTLTTHCFSLLFFSRFLLDFGLARCLNSRGGDSKDRKLTQYIVTRWYRAPEILLGCDIYTEAVDMWGLGCILGEMLQQRPLFPGSDYISQVRRILDYVGRPAECGEGLDFVTNARAKKFVESLELSVPLVDDSDAFFPAEEESVRYLLRQMLMLCPSKRTSCEAALSHEFFVPVRNETSEKVATRKLNWDRIDDIELTKNNLQCLVYNEIGSFMKSTQQRHIRRNSY